MPIRKPLLHIHTSYFDEDTNSIFRESLNSSSHDSSLELDSPIKSSRPLPQRQQENLMLRTILPNERSPYHHFGPDSQKLLEEFRQIVDGTPQLKSQLYDSLSAIPSNIMSNYDSKQQDKVLDDSLQEKQIAKKQFELDKERKKSKNHESSKRTPIQTQSQQYLLPINGVFHQRELKNVQRSMDIGGSSVDPSLRTESMVIQEIDFDYNIISSKREQSKQLSGKKDAKYQYFVRGEEGNFREYQKNVRGYQNKKEYDHLYSLYQHGQKTANNAQFQGQFIKLPKYEPKQTYYNERLNLLKNNQTHLTYPYHNSSSFKPNIFRLREGISSQRPLPQSYSYEQLARIQTDYNHNIQNLNQKLEKMRVEEELKMQGIDPNYYFSNQVESQRLRKQRMHILLEVYRKMNQKQKISQSQRNQFTEQSEKKRSSTGSKVKSKIRKQSQNSSKDLGSESKNDQIKENYIINQDLLKLKIHLQQKQINKLVNDKSQEPNKKYWQKRFINENEDSKQQVVKQRQRSDLVLIQKLAYLKKIEKGLKKQYEDSEQSPAFRVVFENQLQCLSQPQSSDQQDKPEMLRQIQSQERQKTTLKVLKNKVKAKQQQQSDHKQFENFFREIQVLKREVEQLTAGFNKAQFIDSQTDHYKDAAPHYIEQFSQPFQSHQIIRKEPINTVSTEIHDSQKQTIQTGKITPIGKLEQFTIKTDPRSNLNSYQQHFYNQASQLNPGNGFIIYNNQHPLIINVTDKTKEINQNESQKRMNSLNTLDSKSGMKSFVDFSKIPLPSLTDSQKVVQRERESEKIRQSTSSTDSSSFCGQYYPYSRNLILKQLQQYELRNRANNQLQTHQQNQLTNHHQFRQMSQNKQTAKNIWEKGVFGCCKGQ